eukprot:7892711-Lingulodinium_polyedra.AAC.1
MRNTTQNKQVVVTPARTFPLESEKQLANVGVGCHTVADHDARNGLPPALRMALRVGGQCLQHCAR